MSRPPKHCSPEDFGEKNITPMMKQYLQAKAESPADSILLFRAGDFYEMFFEDALRAAPVLDLASTARTTPCAACRTAPSTPISRNCSTPG